MNEALTQAQFNALVLGLPWKTLGEAGIITTLCRKQSARKSLRRCARQSSDTRRGGESAGHLDLKVRYT